MRIKKYLVIMLLSTCGFVQCKTAPSKTVTVSIAAAMSQMAAAVTGAAKTAFIAAATTAGASALTVEDYTSYGWKAIAAPGDCFILNFSGKATNDIHVGLQYGATSYVEVVIGGWNNTKSVVRNYANNVLQEEVDVTAKLIPDTANFVAYTLSISNGCLRVSARTSAGAVTDIISFTRNFLQTTYSAYSFKCFSTVYWMVKDVSVKTTPFVPGDTVAFKLADGCYLHLLEASTNILHISGVEQAVNIFMYLTHFEIVSLTTDAAGKISFTMKRVYYPVPVEIVDTAGFPRRLRGVSGGTTPAVFTVDSYVPATKKISFTAGPGLLVQRDRDRYEQRRQAPPAFWDYAACKTGGSAEDYTFQLIKIAAPYTNFYGEWNIESYATIGNQLKNTDMKDKLPLFQSAFAATGLVADDWLYLTRMFAEYIVRGAAFAEWPNLVVTGTTIKASDFSTTLLNLVINSAVAPAAAKVLAEDMKLYLNDKNFSERSAFAGLTTRLAKLQKIEALLASIITDTNAVAAYLLRARWCNTLLSRVVPQSTDLSSLTVDEKKALQNVIVQAYYVSSRLNASDGLFFDLKKGPIEETSNCFKALGFSKNNQWTWQIETISLILRKIATDGTIPATAADTVSAVGLYLARSLMAMSAGVLTAQELADYGKPGVAVSAALAPKYLAAYYAGYLASSFATKNAIRDLTGCLIKIRGLITGVDSNNYPSLTPYEGAFNYVSNETDIPVDPRQAYFSTKDIAVLAGGRDPLLCVLRVNGRYLQFTGTAERPSWGVAQSAATATQFRLVLMPAAATWTTGPLIVELTMLLPSGDVPLRCVSVGRAAQFGLSTTDSPLRPARAGTGSDSMVLKLANPRYWLTGAVSQPTTQLNGVEVPKSSWLYELDGLHKDHSLFAAADLAKNQFFTTTTKGLPAPAGYVEAYFSFEALPPANTIKTAFLSIPPLESYIRTAKIDAVLDEMVRVAHSANPSESDSFKFARSGEILGKNFHALTVKQQTKLLSSVLA